MPKIATKIDACCMAHRCMITNCNGIQVNINTCATIGCNIVTMQNFKFCKRHKCHFAGGCNREISKDNLCNLHLATDCWY